MGPVHLMEQADKYCLGKDIIGIINHLYVLSLCLIALLHEIFVSSSNISCIIPSMVFLMYPKFIILCF